MATNTDSVTVSEASQASGMSAACIRRAVRNGSLPSKRLGNGSYIIEMKNVTKRYSDSKRFAITPEIPAGYCTLRQACRELGVCEETMRLLGRNEKVKRKYVDGRVFFLTASVSKFKSNKK